MSVPRCLPLAFLGLPAALAAPIDAQTAWTCESDVIFQGRAMDHMGWSIDVRGNWNADAYAGGAPMNDVLAGCYQPGVEKGAAHLMITVEEDAGGADLGFPTSSPSCPLPPNRVIVEGEEDSDFFGYAVAFLGDLDDDGRDDFAVTMVRGPISGSGPTERGAVYVFLSSDPNPNGVPQHAPSPGPTVVPASEASLIVRGSTDGHRFGYSIAAIGDWQGDGDGVPDFVVGAPGDDDLPQTFGGRAYVLSGEEVVQAFRLGLREVDEVDVLVDVALEAGSPAGVIKGDTPGDRLGYSVAHLGEIFGPVHGSDFAVGAPQFDDPEMKFAPMKDRSSHLGTGYVKVFVGAHSSPLKISGTQERERFGFSLAGRADLDGDGLHEILIGSPMWDVPGHAEDNAGKVTVLRGGTGAVLGTIVGDDAPIPHPDAVERLGWGVAGLGDLDGRTGDEIAVGSFGFTTAVAGPFDPASTSPCDPCPKLTPEGLGEKLGGGLAGRAQVIAYDGSGFDVLAEYHGDFRDSAGSALAFLPHVGPGADPAVVVGASRWGSTAQKEAGRVHLFLW